MSPSFDSMGQDISFFKVELSNNMSPTPTLKPNAQRPYSKENQQCNFQGSDRRGQLFSASPIYEQPSNPLKACNPRTQSSANGQHKRTNNLNDKSTKPVASTLQGQPNIDKIFRAPVAVMGKMASNGVKKARKGKKRQEG